MSGDSGHFGRFSMTAADHDPFQIFEPFPDFEPIRLPISADDAPWSPAPTRRPSGFFPSLLRILTALLIICVFGLVTLLVLEFRSNRGQAFWLSEYASRIGFQIMAGQAGSLPAPDTGPYDMRLGYADLPAFQQRLLDAGFYVTSQARLTPRAKALADRGLFRIYDEKTQAGLQLLDMRGQEIYSARYPANVYQTFAAIPDLVLDALMFAEDREILDFSQPHRNPVVDWERLAKAIGLQAMKSAGLSRREIGASTLATQLEKLRHSPGGITHDAGDKLRQMLSATLRVYRSGPVTISARQKLVLDYLNSMPLAALSGYGEVSSLGDGLEAWYGSDFADVNRVLVDPDAPLESRALYFKQILSLILSVRRPSFYLGRDRTALERLCDSYLRRMATEQIISPELRDAALAARLERRQQTEVNQDLDYRAQKGINLVRTRLLPLLGVSSLYELDRLDLSVSSSLHGQVQAGVAEFLRGLASRQRIEELGLTGDRLMSASDPAKVIYSMTLYERDTWGNHLRVNADNFDQPFDINASARLDLGSTAKLRTLVTWLELIADAYQQFAGESATDQETAGIHPRDHLSAWVADYLQQHPGADLQTTLASAMQRRFSASNTRHFYTGGGDHHFDNFDRTDNSRILTVAEALRRSVNLVFIRLMREIVDHYLYRAPNSIARVLEDSDAPGREDYLRRFAEREGRQYLVRFFHKYAGKTREQALQALLDGVQVSPRSLTLILRSLGVIDSAEQLGTWMARYTPDENLSPREVERLYQRNSADNLNLNDRGYLARVHPLELWLLDYLYSHPGATLRETLAASTGVRQEVYTWLMKTSQRRAQDRRILDLLEIEAFQHLHLAWARLGYPFASLTPSLATAIGSSGDRPAALAELMGIILSGGHRVDSRLVQGLEFAADTPYQTRFSRSPPYSEAVMRPEVAAVTRAALIDVVENGTARALVNSLQRADGTRHIAGGKTGTGDHRFEVYSAPGKLLESRVVNRVATFVFLIDERFFGTITAFVPGADAANYKFTSGLPVRLLGALMPTLAPLLDGDRGIPVTDNPGTDSPGAESSGAESSGADSSGADSPGADSPGVDSSGVDSSGVDSPGAESSGADNPATNGSIIKRPDLESPVMKSNGADTPGAGPGSDGVNTKPSPPVSIVPTALINSDIIH